MKRIFRAVPMDTPEPAARIKGVHPATWGFLAFLAVSFVIEAVVIAVKVGM